MVVTGRAARAIVLALVLAGCSAGVAPTPQIVVITAPPAVTVTVAETPVLTPSPVPEPHKLTGTLALTVPVANYGSGPKPCAGTGGFADIREGAAVTVRDEAGVTIGTGRLAAGSLGANVCVFEFTPIYVPDAPFYSIEVSHRGALTYSRADLAARNWTVALTLG